MLIAQPGRGGVVCIPSLPPPLALLMPLTMWDEGAARPEQVTTRNNQQNWQTATNNQQVGTHLNNDRHVSFSFVGPLQVLVPKRREMYSLTVPKGAVYLWDSLGAPPISILPLPHP